MVELQKSKELGDKRLLALEIVIGVLSIIILLSFDLIAAFIPMQTWQRIVLIVFGFILALVGIGFALKIEQVAGYYVCDKCKHKYVPTYSQVLWSAHINRTRYMKCPHCKQKSWNKKVIK